MPANTDPFENVTMGFFKAAMLKLLGQSEDLEKKIEQRGGKFVVLSEDGSKTLGSYATKEEAVERLRQIEGHKKKGMDPEEKEHDPDCSCEDCMAKKKGMDEHRSDTAKKEFVIEIPFKKMDVEKRLVTGVVMEPGGIDLQGDFTDENEIETAAHSFMQKSRVVGKGHESKAKAEVVESYIASGEMDLGGQRVRKGSWVMTVKVHDEELWKEIRGGAFTGFSIGGRSMKIADQEIEVEDEE